MPKKGKPSHRVFDVDGSYIGKFPDKRCVRFFDSRWTERDRCYYLTAPATSLPYGQTLLKQVTANQSRLQGYGPENRTFVRRGSVVDDMGELLTRAPLSDLQARVSRWPKRWGEYVMDDVIRLSYSGRGLGLP